MHTQAKRQTGCKIMSFFCYIIMYLFADKICLEQYNMLATKCKKSKCGALPWACKGASLKGFSQDLNHSDDLIFEQKKIKMKWIFDVLGSAY